MKKEVVILLFLVLIPFINAANCTPFWNCNAWSPCMNNEQIRICYDRNTCGNVTGKPAERQICGTICEPSWQCTEWQPDKCPENNAQQRACIDANNCGTIENKPEEFRSCPHLNDYSWILFCIIAILLILIFGAIWVLIKRTIERRYIARIYKAKPL